MCFVLIILQHAPFDTCSLIKHLLSPDEVGQVCHMQVGKISDSRLEV